MDTHDNFSYVLNSTLEVNEASDGWKEFPVVWPAVHILPGTCLNYSGKVCMHGCEYQVNSDYYSLWSDNFLIAAFRQLGCFCVHPKPLMVNEHV